MATVEARVAKPIVMLDEIDKCAVGNGNLAQALMPFLDRERSRGYPDVGVEVQVDLSHGCYA